MVLLTRKRLGCECLVSVRFDLITHSLHGSVDQKSREVLESV